jgi:hypothetical protein
MQQSGSSTSQPPETDPPRLLCTLCLPWRPAVKVHRNFKEASPAVEVQKVVDAFRALKSKIPEIASFEYGTNNSPEGLNDGFTHCFLVTFKNEKDREAYLPHPAHKAFVELLKLHLDKAMVIDYWAAE